jgi:hypothetical protein
VSTMSKGSPPQLPSDAEVRAVLEENGGNVGVAMVSLHWLLQKQIDELKARIAALEAKRKFR